MAFQAIESIKDAEKKAALMILEAKKKAVQVQKDGREKAEAIIEKAKNEAEGKSCCKVEEARKSCEKEVDKLKEKYRKERELLELTAGENMDRAVGSIVERIVTQYGNS